MESRHSLIKKQEFLLNVSSLCGEVINIINVSNISSQESVPPSVFCSLRSFIWVHTLDDKPPGTKK